MIRPSEGFVLGTRIGRALLTAAVVIVVVAVSMFVLISRDEDRSAGGRGPSDTAPAQLVRDSSHRLNDAADGAVTVVEFLDFECEGCRAAYPVVEELRADYGDRVEFIVRYFPLAGHFNGERAARAVEAAAQQGKFEAMYRKMYETQAAWGEKRTPADDVFRGFAAEMDLDMAAFTTAYDDPASATRVRADVDDGRALGVEGTPTFFVDGEQVHLRARDDLRDAIDSALR